VVQNRSFIGTLYYDRISHISSDVTGLVTKINVREGDRINKGSFLVHLDTEILEKEILINKNQIEQAELLINHSKKNYHRMDSLFKKGGTSEKNYDDARFVYQEAILKKISARTMLEKQMIQKKKSVISAPFNGVVLEKNVDSGDWVQQGKHLISIGSSSDLFVKVPVAETLLQFISIGQSVTVVINAYNRELSGIIDNLSPTADSKTKNVFLKIRIPMQEKVVRNMSATVYISTGTKQELAIIPRDALVKSQGRDMVYTIKKDKAVPIMINIQTYSGNSVGVKNEKFDKDFIVIVDGNERLRPGQSVVVIGKK